MLWGAWVELADCELKSFVFCCFWDSLRDWGEVRWERVKSKEVKGWKMRSLENLQFPGCRYLASGQDSGDQSSFIISGSKGCTRASSIALLSTL